MASSASSRRSPPSFGLRTVTTFDLGKGITLRIARGSVADFDCPGIGAIVNAANEGCLGGGGVDGAISEAGGRNLYRDRLALPVVHRSVRCPTGDVRLTGPGDYDLLKVNYVVHAVGPMYDTYRNFWEPDELLFSAYQASLEACCRRRRSSRTSVITSPAATATSPTSESEDEGSDPLEISMEDEKTGSIKPTSPAGPTVSKPASQLQPSPASSSSSPPSLSSSATDQLPAHRLRNGDDANINPRSSNNTRQNSDIHDGDINPRPSSNRRITDSFPILQGSRSTNNSPFNPTTAQVQDHNTVTNDHAAVVVDKLSIRHVAFSLLSAGIFRGRRSLISVLGIGVEAIQDWVDRTDDCGALETVILCAFSVGEAKALLEACRRVLPDHRR
jgi:O-acetyl-ADP-ribose deacetylase (regulator of RNase III)